VPSVHPSVNPVGPLPRLLKATYLADGESLLKETRSTGLYFFPGPIVALLIVLGLDYAAAGVRTSAVPGLPGLTSWLGMFPTIQGYGPGTYLLAFFLVLTMIVLLLLLVRYLRWVSTVYAVTTSRVIIQRGIFSRDFDEIPVDQVRGVDVHQTFLQRVLGYGSVQVSSEGGRSLGNEAWTGIPKPFQFQRTIESATQNLARGGRVAAAPGFPPPSGSLLRPPGQA